MKIYSVKYYLDKDWSDETNLFVFSSAEKREKFIRKQYESDKKVLSEEGYVIIDYNEWKKVNCILQELELDYYSINKLEL